MLVTYTAIVRDDKGSPILLSFYAYLYIYKYGTNTVESTIIVPFSTYYDVSTQRLTVSFFTPGDPGAYLVKLVWSRQVNEAEGIGYYAWSSSGVRLDVIERREVLVMGESVSPSVVNPGQRVVYTATVQDNTGAAILSGFRARLRIGTAIVINVPFNRYYDASTKRLTVPFTAPITPGSYTVKLEWDEQIIQGG